VSSVDPLETSRHAKAPGVGSGGTGQRPADEQDEEGGVSSNGVDARALSSMLDRGARAARDRVLRVHGVDRRATPVANRR